MSTTAKVLEMAADAGFDLAGVAPLAAPRRAAEFRRWLELGRHGRMEYLADFEPRITDPLASMDWGRSVLVVGLGHSRSPVVTEQGVRIARYAAGRDYHNVLGKRLKLLARDLRQAGLVGEFRKVVDAGPLLERSHAAAAGLGVESKAANLLHPRFGPWFFLGELVLDVELEPTPIAPVLACGSCTACIDACPTGAIVAPGEVDARRCISYLTIEDPGPNALELRALSGAWLFGCDVCSEVCPWGHRAPDLSDRYGTHAAVEKLDVLAWARSPEAIATAIPGSPLQRAGVEGLQRDAIQFLGRNPEVGGEDALLSVIAGGSSPLAREAAAWALAHAHAPDAGARAALERCSRTDPEAWVREHAAQHLDHLSR